MLTRQSQGLNQEQHEQSCLTTYSPLLYPYPTLSYAAPKSGSSFCRTLYYAPFSFLSNYLQKKRIQWLEQQRQSLLKIRNKMKEKRMDVTISTKVTSISICWYHVRSKAADRKCAAPPCLMTYSVQKMAVSSGDCGRSRNIRDSCFMFS
jgi:hypothetical protein